MARLIISDEKWIRLKPALLSVGIYDKPDLRMTIEGIAWRTRTGAPWRDLPAEFGPWSSIYNQFNRWSLKGLLREVFSLLRGELDQEWNFMDATVVRAHQHAAGGEKGQEIAIGRSVGGPTSKVHMLADSFGNPIHFEITEGQVHDVKLAEELLRYCSADFLINDKGYDSEPLREKARKKSIEPIIPRRSNSTKENPEYDKDLYKSRHVIENLFAKLKQFRSIATRYDKLKRNYASVVYLGCCFVWLTL